MTIKDAIEQLSKLPPDLELCEEDGDSLDIYPMNGEFKVVDTILVKDSTFGKYPSRIRKNTGKYPNIGTDLMQVVLLEWTPP